MKKLLLYLLCFCLLTFGSSAKIIEVAPAGAWGVLGISGGGGGGAPPAGGQDYIVDFTEYDASDDHVDGGSGRQWNELTGSGTAVDVASDNLDGVTSPFTLIFESPTDTITQYGAHLVGASTQYNGLYFRSTNNAAERAYALRFNAAASIMWRSCTGHSCDVDIGACDPGFELFAGDSFGFRVTGTSTATVLEMYFWDDEAPPPVTDGDVDTAWAAGNRDGYCTVCASGCDTTWTAPTDKYADTGKYGGFYNGGSQLMIFDNFALGDSTN